MDPVLVVSGVAVAAGLAVALAIKKPAAFALGLGAAALYYALTRSEAGLKLQEEVIGKKPHNSPAETLGAHPNRDIGPARFYGPEESTAPDPSLFPAPFRVKERKFWEDPDDDRIRWHTTGPEGPYTTWRRGFF